MLDNMRKKKADVNAVVLSVTFVFLLCFQRVVVVHCQDYDEEGAEANPDSLNLFTELVYSRMMNMSVIMNSDMSNQLKFCVQDADADWNGAFNFSSDLTFMQNCMKKNKDLTLRLCTAAEVKFYFSSFFQKGSTGAKRTNYLKLNKNCNLTTWIAGCEPGWACRTTKEPKVDLKNSTYIPPRTLDCKPCCEGFFCPHGITCMIPCPLGSYCPQATLNTTTGICEPYHYQLPPGQPNHTCGAADIWADFASSKEVFCDAGSYCPSNIKKVTCPSGHYCRTGSTSETRCFKMTSCESGSANQNITAYGILIFAGIMFLLLIIYNCSDQVITTREKRQAKSREAAAKSARETAQAREKWKSAKDIAKKHASGLQASFSRTFSRRKSSKNPDHLKIFGTKSTRVSEPEAGMPPVPPSSGQSSAASKGKNKEPSDLTKMIRSIEENPDSPEGFNVEIGDKNLKSKPPKGKVLHTRTQIFKYAYGQIEKEKALQEQNQDLTFSGVISMATDMESRSRPRIEVAFKDLTLTLKGKHKHLMRSVTGKISPGRVSAVMGPSGAGKTTFLSALAGKITGSTIRGEILINGENHSIHAYKKIIGFVPQDDIVHGNLTVEENLWFSARCRLPADLPKPEKVLVVERVIESLGLQAVRDSLVGTVEKRGISGGQRKRVNVGLEMVMEPSLLILDEPTSGLDSSSSQLLLRALRREALEGVNVCMVVHQPSYALFKMFDDLILLAKGGMTVYHGSVKKVEEYFTALGIVVPERVNPPDYYIDILEGMVKPTSVKVQELPVRWMVHNGYPVPPDMLAAGSSSEGSNRGAAASGLDAESLAEDLWGDVKHNVESKKDHLEKNFLKSRDLSQRRTPGVLLQYRYFLGRVGKQRLRESRIQAVDYLILLLAGICLGVLAKVNDETFGTLGYTYTVIAASLLCKIAALRSFSLDKLHYWRESESGMNRLSYFLAKDTVDLFNTLIKPLVYLSMFYFFNNPRSSFLDNYVILLCLVYCVTGIAYAFAIFLHPSPAQLWSVLLPVVLTLVANQEGESHFMKYVAKLCYPKWALEAFVLANAKMYSGVWLITRCGYLMARSYDLNNWILCLIVLLVTGVVSRIVAFLCLLNLRK